MSRIECAVATSLPQLLTEEAFRPERTSAELERLALLRDARVRALEGQRGLLVGLLVTLFIGVVLIYATISRPAAARQTAELAELGRRYDDLRHGHTQERETFERRVAGLSNVLRDQERLVEKLRHELTVATTPPKKGTAPNRVTPTEPKPVCRCDKADPLCDCW